MPFSQRLINLISPILILFRYRNKKDPFKQFKDKISSNHKESNDPQKSTIFVVPFRVSPVSNLFEGLLGYFYKMKGHDVKAVLCNQSIHYCENIVHHDEPKRKLICSLCLKEQHRFCDTFKISPIKIDEFVSEKEEKEIDSFIENKTFLKRSDFVINNVNHKKNIESAINRYTLKSEINYQQDQHIVKGYVKTTLFCHLGMTNILKIIDCQRVIMSHGVYSTWGTIMNVAVQKAIPTYVWARGYVGQGNLLFGRNMSYLKDLVIEPSEIYQSLNYTNKNLEESSSYFSQKSSKSSSVEYVNYYSKINLTESRVEEYFQENKISKYKNIFGMFTNIPWDGQIFNQTEGFPNTQFYIDSVFNWFINNPTCCLIIRAHPAEVHSEQGKGSEKIQDLLLRLYNKLPENVFFLPPDSSISSYSLSERIDAAIIYGSSIGLELAIRNIPVIQAGNFYTSNKEIVFEAKSKHELYSLLDKVKCGNLCMKEDQKLNALKFGYYWVYRRHIEDDTIRLKKLIFTSYTFQNLEEFMQSKTLNFLYEKINSKESIII